MHRVELSAGPIEYEDTGGAPGGPTVVFAHGLFMDGRQWRKVLPLLPAGFRCVLPTLPLGAHRLPMNPQADLTLSGQARIVAELLERLDLRDVTLVCNDWSGAQILVAENRTERIARLVLASCETADNYPPGLAGKVAGWSSAVPGATWPILQTLRVRALRRLPMTFGWLSKRPVPDKIMDDWLAPATTRRAIRRDLRAYASDFRVGKRALEAADERLAGFDRPVLVLWAADDRLMPEASGRRLAASFPRAEFRLVPDSYTLISEDQPERFAAELTAFVSAAPAGRPPAAAPSRAAS